MLDINLLRRDLAGVLAQLQRRKDPQPFLDVPRYSALEAERKQIQTATEQLQARRNATSKQIGQRKGKGEDTSALMSEVNGIADELKAGACLLYTSELAGQHLDRLVAEVGVEEEERRFAGLARRGLEPFQARRSRGLAGRGRGGVPGAGSGGLHDAHWWAYRQDGRAA